MQVIIEHEEYKKLIDKKTLLDTLKDEFSNSKTIDEFVDRVNAMKYIFGFSEFRWGFDVEVSVTAKKINHDKTN